MISVKSVSHCFSSKFAFSVKIKPRHSNNHTSTVTLSISNTQISKSFFSFISHILSITKLVPIVSLIASGGFQNGGCERKDLLPQYSATQMWVGIGYSSTNIYLKSKWPDPVHCNLFFQGKCHLSARSEGSPRAAPGQAGMPKTTPPHLIPSWG